MFVKETSRVSGAGLASPGTQPEQEETHEPVLLIYMLCSFCTIGFMCVYLSISIYIYIYIYIIHSDSRAQRKFVLAFTSKNWICVETWSLWPTSSHRPQFPHWWGAHWPQNTHHAAIATMGITGTHSNILARAIQHLVATS